MLILKAFSKIPSTINRIAGYTDAFNIIVKDVDSVSIPVARIKYWITNLKKPTKKSRLFLSAEMGRG